MTNVKSFDHIVMEDNRAFASVNCQNQRHANTHETVDKKFRKLLNSTAE